MSRLQETYASYLEKRELLETLDQQTLSEIQQEQTAIAVSKTLTERIFPSWMLSKKYKEQYETDLKNEKLVRLNEQEYHVQTDRATLLQEIIHLQNTLPSIVLLSVDEVNRLEILIDRLLHNVAQIEVVLQQLHNTVSSSGKKATTGILAEWADLLVENRRKTDTKWIRSRGIDVVSTLLSQRTFSSHDEINEQVSKLNPLVEEINQLVDEITQIETRQQKIDDRKKPIKWLNTIKDYRVVEYLDLLQDVIFPNTKYDIGSWLSLLVQAFVKHETSQLSTQITFLKSRLAEIKNWCAHAKKDISLYRVLTREDDADDKLELGSST